MPTTGNLALTWDERIAAIAERVRALPLAPYWLDLLAATRDESVSNVSLRELNNQRESELLELADQIAVLRSELPPADTAHRAPNYRPGLGFRSIPENETNARRHEHLDILAELIHGLRVSNARIWGLVEGSAIQWRHDGPRIKSARAVANGRVKAKQSRKERHQKKMDQVKERADQLINSGEEPTRVNSIIAKEMDLQPRQIANLRK